MSAVLLDVQDIEMRFGGLVAVNGVSLNVGFKEVVSLIGPNGAGKTTVFNCLTGFYKLTSGVVRFKDVDLKKKVDFKIARLGMIRTFQHVRLFKNMTVLENLLVAQNYNLNTSLLSGLFKTSSFKKSEKIAIEQSEYWLNKMDLLQFANKEAHSLSYGQQRKVELARCMVTKPDLLMLDEPAAGLNPSETEELDQLITDLKTQYNISVLLIEHDMKLVMEVSDRIYVINQGKPLASGIPSEVRNHPGVIEAYLGES